MLTAAVKKRLDALLEDDEAARDITSALVPDRRVRATVTAGQACVFAGAEEAAYLFKKTGACARVKKKDGARVKKNEAVLEVKGRARAVLCAERAALNVLGRMSGVATLCARAARVAARYGVRVALTRKTAPGCQALDKKAAALGGAWPHRASLADAFLIKDNHLAVEPDITALVARALSRRKQVRARFVEAEAGTLAQALQAARAGAHIVMLDNFSVARTRTAIQRLRARFPRTRIEVSGGVTFQNLAAYCRARPDLVSMGALTRHAATLDFSLAITSVGKT